MLLTEKWLELPLIGCYLHLYCLSSLSLMPSIDGSQGWFASFSYRQPLLNIDNLSTIVSITNENARYKCVTRTCLYANEFCFHCQQLIVENKYHHHPSREKMDAPAIL